MTVIERLEALAEKAPGLPAHYDDTEGVIYGATGPILSNESHEGELREDEVAAYVTALLNAAPALLKLAHAAAARAHVDHMSSTWALGSSAGLQAVKDVAAALEPLLREEGA
jgi:hypothetical protein